MSGFSKENSTPEESSKPVMESSATVDPTVVDSLNPTVVLRIEFGKVKTTFSSWNEPARSVTRRRTEYCV